MHSESCNKASKLGCMSVYVVVYETVKITWWLWSSSVWYREDDVMIMNRVSCCKSSVTTSYFAWMSQSRIRCDVPFIYCVVIFTLVSIVHTSNQIATNILTSLCEILCVLCSVKELESRYNGQPFCLFQWPLALSADNCYAGIVQFVLVVVVTVEVVEVVVLVVPIVYYYFYHYNYH